MSEKNPEDDRKKSGEIPENATVEENELVSQDICQDLTCSTVQNKKILSLKEGLADLDKILASIQGLCVEKSCPFNRKSKSTTNTQVLKQPIEIPTRTQFATEENNEVTTNIQAPQNNTDLHRTSLGIKNTCEEQTCPVLLGETKKQDVFGFETNLPYRNKSYLCKDPVCYNSYFGYKLPESNLKSCDYSTYSSSKKPDFFISELNKKVPCEGETCPFTTKNKPDTHLSPLDLNKKIPCDSVACPFASKDKPGIPFSKQIVYGSKPTAYLPPTLNTNVSNPCGVPTCPFLTPKNTFQPATVGSCPLAQPEFRENGAPFNGQKSNTDQVVFCGQPTCPFSAVVGVHLPKSNFPQNTTNPSYIPQNKQYHCGSFSCTNLDPSSMIYTHFYANDYGFVQEAARPYCGSACPYDYLSSVNNKFPNMRAYNYPTFDCNTTVESVSCPYLSKARNTIGNKAQRKKSSGRETIGACGASKMYSCENPEVIPCESPDCEGQTKNSKKFTFCTDCGGVLPEKDTDANLNPAGSKDFTKVDSVNEVIGNEIAEDIVGTVQVISSQMLNNNTSSENKDQNINKAGEILTKKKSKKSKMTLYSYPGVQIGHKECYWERKPIPRNMGWLWNIKPEGNIELWRGYKPGAVSRAVHKIMKAHKRSITTADSSEVSRKKKNKIKFKLEDLKHCVELKKQNGDYLITVNPLRDPKTLEPSDNPFMDVTPMQFKIEKEKKEKEEIYCPCDESIIESIPSTVSSEIQFHFSPPAAIPNPRPRKLMNMKERDTQYDVNDLPAQLRTSIPNSKEKVGKKGGKKGEKKGGKKGEKKGGKKGGKDKKKKK